MLQNIQQTFISIIHREWLDIVENADNAVGEIPLQKKDKFSSECAGKACDAHSSVKYSVTILWKHVGQKLDLQSLQMEVVIHLCK